MPELPIPLFIKKTLELVYQDGIDRILEWKQGDRNVKGRFLDGIKLFEFTIDDQGINYKPIERDRKLDSWLIGYLAQVHGVDEVFPSDTNEYALQYLKQRTDSGRKRNCSGSTSYSCGNTCIHNKYACRVGSLQVKQASGALLDRLERSAPPKIGSSGKVEYSPAAIATLKRVEDEIRTLPIERIVVIHPQTGEILLENEGDETSVDIDHRKIHLLKDAIVTHNHPNLGYPADDPRAKGVSLSGQDMVSAMMVDAAEIRAVSAGYDHSIKRPEEGWKPDREKFSKTYNRHAIEVSKEFELAILDGADNIEELETNYQHEINTRVAKSMGWEYKREELPPNEAKKAIAAGADSAMKRINARQKSRYWSDIAVGLVGVLITAYVVSQVERGLQEFVETVAGVRKSKSR